MSYTPGNERSFYQGVIVGIVVAAAVAFMLWPRAAHACQSERMQKFEKQVQADLEAGRNYHPRAK